MAFTKEQKIKNARIARIKWNKNNKEKHQEINRRWYVNNKEVTNKRTMNGLFKKYGITEADYNQMFVNQNGRCLICKNTAEKGKRLFVDHCHETGKVRGLLCNLCNSGLGFFKDSSANLKNAIKYLKNS